MTQVRRPTAKTTKTPVPADAPENEEAPAAEGGEDPSLDQIDELLSGHELTQAKIRIHRRPPNSPKFAYCTTMDASEFDLEKIKQLYGGGEYQIVLLDQEGHYVKRRSLTIDPRIRGGLDPRPEGDGTNSLQLLTAASSAGKVGSTDMIDRFLLMQSENSKLMFTMMAESQKSMATMVAAMMGGKGGGGGLELKDVLALLPALQKGGGGTTPAEMLGVLREMREMIAEEAPEEKGGLLQTLGGLAPGLLSLFQGRMGGPQLLTAGPEVAAPIAAIEDLPAEEEQPQAHQAPAHVAPTRPQGPNGQGPGPGQMRRQPPNEMAMTIQLVLAGARKSKDPGLYADLILEQLDQPQAEQLQNILTADNWLELIFGNIPDLEKLRPWFKQLREFILKSLNDTDPAEQSEQSDGGAGPGGDAVPRVQSDPGAAAAG